MTNEISVKSDRLTRRFGNFTAVDQVSIDVYQGEIFGFLGPNGAGKTTIIRMLAGLLKPTDGQAWVAGFDVYSQSEKIKQNIGYMSQRFSLYEDLTIGENIEFYGGIYGLDRQTIKQQKEKLIDRFALHKFAHHLTGDLPLGFKQRLALGCALLHDPPIVFLDEPTSGVDPKARREFWDLIYETAEQGKTVFVSTHFMVEAEYCNRISIMREGKLIAMDSPENLRREYCKKEMQDVFIAAVKTRTDK